MTEDGQPPAADAPRDPQLLVLGAADRDEMRLLLEQVRARADGLTHDELDELAAEMAAELPPDARVRAAALVRDANTLVLRLGNLERWLDEHEGFRGARGSFLGVGPRCRIGFLFPGQGVPVYTNAGALGDRFPSAREPFEGSGLPERREDVPAGLVQMSVIAATLAGLRTLRELGVDADLAVGHSMGELAALYWSGAVDEATALRIARAGESIVAHANADGTMATIFADDATVDQAVEGTGAAVAAYNSPGQRVVAGTRDAVAAATGRARELGARVFRVNVTGAYHTPLMLDALGEFQGDVAKESVGEVGRRVISSVYGGPLAPDTDVHDLIARLFCEPVKFMQAAEIAVGESDLLIEVGPGKMLSGLVSEFTDVPAVPIRAGAPSAYGLLEVAGAAYAAGSPVHVDRLFAGMPASPGPH